MSQGRKDVLARYAILAAEYAQGQDEGVLERLHEIEDSLGMSPEEIIEEIQQRSQQHTS